MILALAEADLNTKTAVAKSSVERDKTHYTTQNHRRK